MSGWPKVGVFAVACVLASAGGQAQEQPKAAAPEQPKAVARQVESRLDVEYGVVLEAKPGDKPSELAVLREVKTGERFHFRLRPKQTANAYVFVADKKGGFELLLPGEEKKRSSEISRNQWSTLPEADWLKFDEVRGTERIYLFMSAGPIREIEELFASGRTLETVDETWLLELRNKLDAEGSTTFLRGADVMRMTHRRRGNVPAVIVEEFNVRHK
jgi:Domain of unknown function (DUF4384)